MAKLVKKYQWLKDTRVNFNKCEKSKSGQFWQPESCIRIIAWPKLETGRFWEVKFRNIDSKIYQINYLPEEVGKALTENVLKSTKKYVRGMTMPKIISPSHFVKGNLTL